MLKGMRLLLRQVRKPIRALQKSLRDLPDNLSEKAIHDLRTRSRRVEAIGSVLAVCNQTDARPLLRSIKPLRKAAGEVRDMDVLAARVRSLLRRNQLPALERLLAHLKAARAKNAEDLAKKFSAQKKTLYHRLEQYSKDVKERFADAAPDSRQAHELFDELSRWPRLTADNLHAFRVKIKELRYMMQLMRNTNSVFMSALENARTRIGIWHDWEELHRIAAEVLNADRDKRAIALIVEKESEKFRSAMRAAQSLRTRYLKCNSMFEINEP
jgi:CHAD domain-containing protein